MAAILAAPAVFLSNIRPIPRAATHRRPSTCLLSRRSRGYSRGRGRGRAVVVLADGGGEEGRKESAGLPDGKEQRRPALNLRWRDLLAPEPDNILAVALSGLLAWASLQALWQIFFISIAILLAALKLHVDAAP